MLNLTGYHGTNRINGNMILSTKKFNLSGGFKDWLGRGVYFFEDDKHQSYMFAKFKIRGNVLKHEDICVIKALLECEEGRCLNLLCDDDREFLSKYAAKLAKKIESKKQEIGNWHHKEGFVLDFLHKSGSCYDLIKAAYQVPGKKVDEVLEYVPVHIQVCVKNVECINEESICEENCDAYNRV